MCDTSSAGAGDASAGATDGSTGGASFIRSERLRLTDGGAGALNDAWLRERIVDDPSILGLGDLRLADEGRVRDGRLELLLRDPASGRRIVALVRAGSADDADLVRAIENWTIERTRYPEHAHFAVLVAEELPPRLLGAIGTLGATIPLSAIQLGALRVGEHVALAFTVVIDRLPPRAPGPVNGSPNGAARKVASVVNEPEHEPVHEPEPEPASVVETPAPAVVAAAPAQPQPAVEVKLPAWLSDDARTEANGAPAPGGVGSRVFSLLCVVSLLLCAAAAFGWVRSYSVQDVRTFADRAGGDHFVYSNHGQLEWIAPAPAADPARGERSVKVPYWLPVGITAILPFAWLIQRRSRAVQD